MKRIRLDRWACQLQPPRNPRLQLQQRCLYTHDSTVVHRPTAQRRDQRQCQWSHRRGDISTKRRASSVASAQIETTKDLPQALAAKTRPQRRAASLSSSGPSRTAKLSALHARLSLPASLPLQTLARCLVDESADPYSARNNASMAVLGQDLLAYYTTEHLMVHYPRLPMSILHAAQYAYSGPATLASIRADWGVEIAAEPGMEVDPALLQLKRMTPGNAMSEDGMTRIKDVVGLTRLNVKEQSNSRRGLSRQIVYDDEFGDVRPDAKPTKHLPAPTSKSTMAQESEEASSSLDHEDSTFSSPKYASLSGTDFPPATVEEASATFIRALAGAIYLHAGQDAAKNFHRDHILSRHLELHKLFHFTHPTRDLSRLCAREGFESPVARLISETGRLSRHPVFVVAVYSGEDKLGEDAGSSLNEGRVRASAAAMRAWYLYSPPVDDIMRPSDVEGPETKQKTWKAQMVDPGEVVT